eukprot:TRINITY_DN4683_c0_g1_i1.p1 TRINITY_DN4683_c0_g1~~TRINITY_DN4683_c0_g1_i1.p1  ORF type:complete len:449 (+),score=144.29 TRINITY_DN4683_c0_g1_i1:42-1349(+)
MALRCLLVALLVALCAASASAQPPTFRSLGSFAVKDASFTSIVPFEGDAGLSLLVSAFSGSPLAQDTLHIVRNISSYFPDNVNAIKAEVLTSNVTWPNQSGKVPDNVFGNNTDVEYAWVGGGFLPPGKRTGAITLSAVDLRVGSGSPPTPNGNTVVISPTLDDYFYHICLWHDMNNDGLQDCVAAHTYQPPVGKQKGQLVYFAQPSSNPLQSIPWPMTVLTAGPDIFVHLTPLYGAKGQPAIVAAEFFTQALRLYWTDEAEWTAGSVKSLTIDDAMGAPFDVQVVDLNGDGKPELLASNHQHEADQSAVFAYEIPQDWSAGGGPWKRHVLTSNITTLKVGPNQASPGNAIAFSPSKEWAGNKPWILLSGDGSEYAYLLTPASEEPTDWRYSRQDVLFTGCTVGEISVGDVDGDGYSEFFVPAYEKGTVFAYTFAP